METECRFHPKVGIGQNLKPARFGNGVPLYSLICSPVKKNMLPSQDGHWEGPIFRSTNDLSPPCSLVTWLCLKLGYIMVQHPMSSNGFKPHFPVCIRIPMIWFGYMHIHMYNPFFLLIKLPQLKKILYFV